MNKVARFGFIPIVFVLLILSTALLNLGNIIKDKGIVASEYSSTWIVGMLVLAVVLEFTYLFLDKFLQSIFG